MKRSAESISPRRIGRYELVRVLGEGGMGTVHLARWSAGASIERLVALKVMHRELSSSPEFRRMFREEARIAAGLRHQFVCDVLDVGEEDGQLFIAMEYLEGLPLSDVIEAREARQEPSDVFVLARAFANLAEGLWAIHRPTRERAGYVHRDISPQNLFVLRDGSVRIADFGLAFDPKRPLPSASGTTCGKFAYIAPELLDGGAVTSLVDLWSLGVVFWEALVGRPLFRGESGEHTRENVRTLVVPAPSTLCEDVPPELDRIVMDLLQRDWRLRTKTARTLASDLADFLAEQRAMIEPSHVGRWVRELSAPSSSGESLRPMRARMVLPQVDRERALSDPPARPMPKTTLPSPPDPHENVVEVAFPRAPRRPSPEGPRPFELAAVIAPISFAPKEEGVPVATNERNTAIGDARPTSAWVIAVLMLLALAVVALFRAG